MRSNKIQDAVMMVARDLAEADGWCFDTTLTIAPGVTIPIWVAYVETADRLIRDASVMKRVKP